MEIQHAILNFGHFCLSHPDHQRGKHLSTISKRSLGPIFQNHHPLDSWVCHLYHLEHLFLKNNLTLGIAITLGG